MEYLAELFEDEEARPLLDRAFVIWMLQGTPACEAQVEELVTMARTRLRMTAAQGVWVRALVGQG